MTSGKILIIEASGFLHSVLGAGLKQARLPVDGVRSLRDAVDYFQKRSPGLILFDLDLPGKMKVEKACQLIKRIPRCRDVPIILITSSLDGIEEKVKEAGGYGYLRKPFTPGNFIKWLKKHPELLVHLEIMPTAGPAPVAPAPVAPAPVAPAPVEPAPVAPAPVEPTPVAPALVAPAPVAPAPVAPAPVAPAPVMIIDESEFVVGILRQALASNGLQCLAAGSVGDGAALLKDGLPACIFIDLNLPDMAGDEACLFLKSIPSCRDIPIFLTSAAQAGELAERVSACHADGYLLKPFTPDEFMDFLKARGILETQNNVSASVAPPPSPVVESAPIPPLPAPLDVSASVAPLPESTIVSDPAQAEEAEPGLVMPALPPLDDDFELDDLPAVVLEPSSLVMDDAGAVKIEKSPDSDPLYRLEKHIRSGKIENRVQACLALGKRRLAESVPLLVSILEERDPDLMAEACWSLGELGDPAAVPALVDVLQGGRLLIKTRALEALGKIGDTSAVPHIIACLADSGDELKIPILRSLAAIGGQNAEKALEHLASDYNRKVAQEAVSALEKLRKESL